MRLAAGLFLCALLAAAQDGNQQFASIGDLKLQSGEVLRDCRVGYRTFGRLNARRDNAVIFPTWFTGRSENLADNVGPGKLVDSTRFYVILFDALGDGVSSSPSNSAAQPRMRFPKFSIRDMVEAEHAALTRVLGLDHVHAVLGISMGGMQTFQWMVSYPDFMNVAVPIVGSPRLTATDLLLWTAEEHAIEGSSDWREGGYTGQPLQAMRTVQDIHNFALTTPAYRAQDTPPAAFPAFLSGIEKPAVFDANDWLRQLQAMLTMDVGNGATGLETAAARVKAKVLVVVAAQDHMVNPLPALAFAQLLHAPVLTLEGDCGHLAPGCESAKMTPAVARFLQ